ncbi:hypothetical protein DT73_06480 [Mangrovibacter sp. MFB070]|nr:hypothetical protein DT73_06480 [Mangrovibacter sp. MFB070]
MVRNLIKLMDYQNQGSLRSAKRQINNASGLSPDWIAILSHPDSNRRPRNYTESADLRHDSGALAGFQQRADLPPVGNFAPP